MRIGIDVSQLAYEKTGVSEYLKNLIEELIGIDKNNDYILFFSSLRRSLPKIKTSERVKIKKFRFPPMFLDLLWNKLHIFSIENFVGNVDIFITSDWTEPPARKAKKVTILYDLIVYKTPHETAKKIVEVQKRKLDWVKKESSVVFCISESSKKDAREILGIEEKKLSVIYPGTN